MQPKKFIPFKRYWNLLARYIQPQWPAAVLLAILLLTMIGLQAGNPLILRYFIDSSLAGQPLSSLIGAAIAFMGIALIRQLLGIAETYLAESVAWTATNALRNDVAFHCLRLDMSFHNAHTPGELIERVDGDITILANFFSRFAIALFGNLILLTGVLILLVTTTDWRAGLALTLFSGIAAFLLSIAPAVARKLWAVERENDAQFFGFLGEQLEGTEDIRSNGATSFVLNTFYKLLRGWYLALNKAKLTSYLMWNSGVLVFAIGTAVSLGVGAYLHEAGIITIGTIYLIYQYNILLQQPVEQLRAQIQNMQGVVVSLERIEQLLAETPRVKGGEAILPQSTPSLEFRDVSFAYVPETPVLHHVSFTLSPGRKLGIVGRTGSGKTTIARLLMRQYESASGQILLGNQDIRGLALADVKQKIAMVMQEVQLFHATIRDNLTFFDPSVSDEQIVQAIHAIGLNNWYQRLPEGLETLLMANEKLSAGEAQLLALVRVFLRDPLLICLDEASSRLDPATERQVQKAINKLLQGRTSIIIAHHLTTLEHVDDVLVLENGYMREFGSRADLLEDSQSAFSRLLRAEQEVAAK